jgi:hypothetical protein
MTIPCNKCSFKLDCPIRISLTAQYLLDRLHDDTGKSKVDLLRGLKARQVHGDPLDFDIIHQIGAQFVEILHLNASHA